MTRKLVASLVLLLGLVLLPGCPSFTSHQTAEVLDKDQIEFGAGFGVIKYSWENSDGKDETLTLPYFPEIMFRFGITDNMDAGFKIGGLSLEGDMKYQLLQLGDKKTSNFTLSVQPSLSYSAVMWKVALGVVVSQRINEMNVLYANIKYNYWGINIDADSDNADNVGGLGDGSYLTATIGYSLEGKKWWLRPEVSFAMDTDFDLGFWLPALGFGFKF